MLSIIIPTLNEEKWIGNLLRCLCNQTFKDFEVIQVDGNSSDKTVSIANRFKKSLDLRVIKSKKKGPSIQRNLGAKNAKYDLLLFLDADVSFNKYFLKSCVHEFKKRKISIASVRLIPDSDQLAYKIFFTTIYLLSKFIGQFLFQATSGSCIFVKKSIHNKVGGFDEKIKLGEDTIYALAASKCGKYRLLHQKIIYSVRRFESEGTKRTMWRWIMPIPYVLFGKKEILNEIDYQFGKHK